MKTLVKVAKFSCVCALVILIATDIFAQPNNGSGVLSIEGAYFHPRRSKFREFYGSGFPALGIRVDAKFKQETWLSFKSRFVKMSKYEELTYYNISIGVMFKRLFQKYSNIAFYGAIGPQFEIRIVDFPNVNTTTAVDSVGSQSELKPSLALEAGMDLWATSILRISPNMNFTYFPFGNPTRGDFGDTGGFYFVLSIGIRL